MADVTGTPATRPPLVITALRTERLALVPLDPHADASSLHEMLSDPLVHRFDTDAEPAGSVEETERRLRLQVVANEGTTWAIRLHGGAAIGTIGVFANQGTTIRGVGWSLSASYWGRGIMSEAARAAVPFLLDQPGVDGLEAWVDSRNVTSLAVARAAGMTERGRLPRVYPDRVAQTVVMVRASVDTDPEVLGAFATLQVRDVAETLRVLRCVVCLHVAWALPDPPVLAFVAFEPWSGSAGFQVQQSAGPIVATAMSLDVGISVDVVRERVVSAGLPVVEEPADMPWARRQMVFLLPEGHRLTVSGPSSPHP